MEPDQPPLQAWPQGPRLTQFLGHFNALRNRAGTGVVDPLAEHLDGLVEILFNASQHLIVYGSLAPGQSNHHQLDGLSGQWQTGWIHGALRNAGWAAGLGYTALQWDPAGPRVPAHWFRSSDLPQHWPRLDRFEGADYRRVLIPFHSETGVIAVGNVYVSATA